MAFFKWKAYDSDIKYTTDALYRYHTGVIQCDSFEMAVLQLARRGLVVKELQPIDYIEYTKLRTIEERINRLKTRIQPPKTQAILEPHHIKWQIWVILLLVIVIVFLLMR
jgi:hypothetical protein